MVKRKNVLYYMNPITRVIFSDFGGLLNFNKNYLEEKSKENSFIPLDSESSLENTNSLCNPVVAYMLSYNFNFRMPEVEKLRERIR